MSIGDAMILLGLSTLMVLALVAISWYGADYA